MSDIKQVLVVDDDPDIAGLLSRKLVQLGYSVDTHCRAREAAARAKACRAKLVILDVMLGDGIGYKVARELRQDPVMYPVPILFQSVLDDQRDIAHAYSEGGDGYLTKPYSLNDLTSKLAEMQHLWDEVKRKCSTTNMRTLTYLRRKVDHRLFRNEPLALTYVHPLPVGDEVAPERVVANSLRRANELAGIVATVIANMGFFETCCAHMGGGYFMVMTQQDDGERFAKSLVAELASAPCTAALRIGVDTLDSSARYEHASEMFDELKEPASQRKGAQAREHSKRQFDAWQG